MTQSTSSWHRELRAFLRALGPALHDRLLLSVKADAFLAVQMPTFEHESDTAAPLFVCAFLFARLSVNHPHIYTNDRIKLSHWE